MRLPLTLRVLALVGLAGLSGLAACAPAETARPGDRPGAVPADEAPADSVVVDEADESPEGLALVVAEEAWVAGEYGRAIEVTDSLSSAWSRRPGIGERPVRRLARLLLARAADVEAVDQLLRHPSALDESWRREMRAATERMSVAELDELSRRVSSDERAQGIVRAEHARALALSGEDERAREAARALADADLYDPDRRKVEDVLAGRIEPGPARVRIGVVVPRSGGFEPVGDQLIEGARLAARAYEERTGVPVELVIVDETTAVDSTGLDFEDAGEPRGDAEAGEGEEAGGIRVVGGAADPDAEDEEAVLPPAGDDARAERRIPADLAAVIGPVMSEGLRATARARVAPGLVLLSPTASEDSALAPHAYSLWDRARRDSLEATTLGNWLVSAFEPRTIDVTPPDSAPPPVPAARSEPARVGALHPDDDSGYRRARILREVAEGAGFVWVGGQAYEPDSTTHEAEIARLAEADPDFVYVIADGTRQVLQVAPQLHFYGLRGRITLVNQDWTHPVVLRRLDEPFSDYRVAGVYFEREQNAAWERFSSAWEAEYRQTLPENAFGALGYDAVALVLEALPDPALVRPAALARALTRLDDVQGVTGTFSFDPESRRLSRDARAWMIRGSELVEPDAREILEWSIETREQELERLDREAAEEARRRGEP